MRIAPLAQAEAAAYLARDPVGNVEPLVSLLHDEDVGAWGAWREGHLVGVLVAGRQWKRGPRTVAVEGDEAGVTRALLAAVPPDTAQFAVHRAAALPLVAAALPLDPAPVDVLRYLAARAVAPPAGNQPPPPAVRRLTGDDAALVAASATPWGEAEFADALHSGYRVFGVVQGGRLVARAMAAYATGHTEEVAAVWTAHRWRGRGLATAVAAAVAADVLARVPVATYAVRPDNLASLRVAEKAGFAPVGEVATYRIVR